MPTRPELIPTRIQRRALLCQAGANVHVLAWLVGPHGQGQGAWRESLISHLSVLAGTGSLMWLVTLALRDPAVVREPTPMLAASRAMVVTAEKPLPRFWLPALGLGALFGVAAGMGPVLLLAADLTLFWAVGRVSLILQRRKLQHDGTS